MLRRSNWLVLILAVIFYFCVIITGCSEKGPGIVTPESNDTEKRTMSGKDTDIVKTNNVNTVISPVHLKKTGETSLQVVTGLPPTEGILVVALEITYRINPGDPHFLADQVLVTIPKWGTNSQDLLIKYFRGTVAEVRILPMSELSKMAFPT